MNKLLFIQILHKKHLNYNFITFICLLRVKRKKKYSDEQIY